MELKLINLSKHYGGKYAVRRVDAILTPGIYALLGSNGAGKTTLMRLICGACKPSEGKILLDGKQISEWGESYFARIGYMPQVSCFYPDFTVMEFMEYMAVVKGIGREKALKRASELLGMVHLQDAANQKIKSLSGGMKQRLGIAQAEINAPDILVLDEPTAGLDPRERVHFRNFISVLAQKRTILLSTHILSDISDIADTILFMDRGKLLLQTPLSKIANGAQYAQINLEELFLNEAAN